MSIKTKAELAAELVSILTTGGLLTALEDRGMRQNYFDSLAALKGNNAFVGDQGITGALSISGVVTNLALTASKLMKTDGSKNHASSSFADSDIQNGATIYAVATGTNSYAVTLAPVPSTYAAGNSYRILFTNANTAAATLAVNGGSAKAIKKNGASALVSGDIQAGAVYSLTYDGTNFQLDNSGFASAVGYKSYVAFLTQSGTAAPGATVLKNEIGTLTFSRVAAGEYVVSSAGNLFLAGKTVALFSNPYTDGAGAIAFILISTYAVGSIQFYTFDAVGNSLDDMLNQTSVEIRVYN